MVVAVPVEMVVVNEVIVVAETLGLTVVVLVGVTVTVEVEELVLLMLVLEAVLTGPLPKQITTVVQPAQVQL